MSDIAERLRIVAVGTRYPKLFDDAAGELDRLEAIIDNYQKPVGPLPNDEAMLALGMGAANAGQQRLASRYVHQLELVVEKLPKTEDGVPVAHGDTTYCGETNHFPHQWALRDRYGVDYETHLKNHGETQFSTREAAEAAKGK